MDIVAKIQLARGESGYYDELSGTFLNWNNPTKNIYAGTDCTNLRRAARYGRIKLLAGSLGTEKTFKEILMRAKAKRTGEDLETLMGDTPLAKEPTEVIDTDDKAPSDESSVITGSGGAMMEGDDNEDIDGAPVLTGLSMTAAPAATNTESTPEEDAPKKTETSKETEETNEITGTDATTEAVAEDPKEDLSVSPKTIRSLKVGASRAITTNYAVTEASSDNDNTVSTEIADGVLTITGVAAGSTKVKLVTENGEATVSVTVVEA